jgi:hypothetical protein
VLAPKAVGLEGFEVYHAPAGFLQPGRDAARAALAWLDTAREPVFLAARLRSALALRPCRPEGPALPLRAGDYGWVDERRYADPEALRRMRDVRGRRADADAALGQFVAARARGSRPRPS